MLKQRIITALLLLLGLGVVIFVLPSVVWHILLIGVGVLAAWEWQRIVGLHAIFTVILYTLVVAVLSAYLYTTDLLVTIHLVKQLYLAAAFFWLIIMPLCLKQRWQIANKTFLGQVRGVIVGVLLIVPTALALMQLHAVGAWFMLAWMAPVWLADIAAYFSGKRFGKHKLAPAISPGKTWEGAVGGALAVAIYALLVGWHNAWVTDALSASIMLAGSILFVALSVEGDLFESLAKRQAGIKDSSQLLPGHGGILDRIDSLTATLPFAALGAYFLQLPR